MSAPQASIGELLQSPDGAAGKVIPTILRPFNGTVKTLTEAFADRIECQDEGNDAWTLCPSGGKARLQELLSLSQVAG